MLDVIGVCLLNNNPEGSNFGGIMKAGVGHRLTVGISGTGISGDSGVVQGSNITGLTGTETCVQSVAES